MLWIIQGAAVFVCTDEEIWTRILQSDESAWTLLVRRYEALVNTVIFRCGLSYSEAADCFQQTWVTLYKNRHKIEAPSRISSWLVTTAKREAVRQSTRLRKESSSSSELPTVIAGDPLPDKELEQLETAFILERAITELDARCRKLIELLFFATKTFSYKQIAAKLGISSNALGPARKRCLTRLKAILINKGYSDALF